LLIQAFNEQVTAFQLDDYSLVAILGVVGIMTLGIIGGARKLAFALFLYHVPYSILKGEYESYYVEITGNKRDKVMLFVGCYLFVFSAIEFLKPFLIENTNTPRVMPSLPPRAEEKKQAGETKK
jgi:hypothetical protein